MARPGSPRRQGPALADLYPDSRPVGFVEARKERGSGADSDAWRRRTSPPDYRDRHVEFGFRRDLVKAGHRVLMVDDWVATGATAVTVKGQVEDSGATWIGVATLVDGVRDSRLRRDLPLRSVLHERDLGWCR